MESRALFLKPAVCRVIKARCVPFAWNGLFRPSYKAEAAFWAKLEAQGLRGGNVMFLCSANGKFLGLYINGDLQSCLTAWQKLPAAERRPSGVKIEDRGPSQPTVWAPQPPENGLILKSYIRALDRDKQGRWIAPAKLSLGVSRTVIPAEPNRDFFWLTQAEWQSLLPAKFVRGQTTTAPASVCARLARFHLVDGACCLPGIWPPETFRECQLTISVAEVLPAEVRLALRGQARFTPRGSVVDFDLDGVLVCDPVRRTIRQFDLVGVSRTPIHKDTATGKLLRLGVAFELGRPDRTADRRPPFAIWEGQQSADRYFAGIPAKP
jgi:hypothetical protein